MIVPVITIPSASMYHIYIYIYIIESVDSISRDEGLGDVPLTQYITNA